MGLTETGKKTDPRTATDEEMRAMQPCFGTAFAKADDQCVACMVRNRCVVDMAKTGVSSWKAENRGEPTASALAEWAGSDVESMNIVLQVRGGADILRLLPPQQLPPDDKDDPADDALFDAFDESGEAVAEKAPPPPPAVVEKPKKAPPVKKSPPKMLAAALADVGASVVGKRKAAKFAKAVVGELEKPASAVAQTPPAKVPPAKEKAAPAKKAGPVAAKKAPPVNNQTHKLLTAKEREAAQQKASQAPEKGRPACPAPSSPATKARAAAKKTPPAKAPVPESKPVQGDAGAWARERARSPFVAGLKDAAVLRATYKGAAHEVTVDAKKRVYRLEDGTEFPTLYAVTMHVTRTPVGSTAVYSAARLWGVAKK